ncbi:MAG: MFS transporter [Chloroflexi bacterium]|nr:MFS transporter [Chloroflexota bacterium]
MGRSASASASILGEQTVNVRGDYVEERLRTGQVFLLSFTHASVDLNPSAIAALLPVFYLSLHLSIGQTAVLTGASQIANSLAQLPFGYLADRVSLRFLIPLGCATASIGLALTAFTHSFPALIAAVCLSGAGVAVYHPEGARTAGALSGRRKATGMSIFSVGGNLGFALGPITASAINSLHSTAAYLLFLVPACLVTVMFAVTHGIAIPEKHRSTLKTNVGQGQSAVTAALILLLLITTLRSALQVGLMTFVPLFEVTQRHHSAGFASLLMTCFLLSGALGTVLGGIAADRIGRTLTLFVSFVFSAPFLVLYYHTSGVLSAISLVAAGGFLISTFAVTVVMGQELLPNRAGVAASLTIGVTSGIGGFLVALLGQVAQHLGFIRTLDLLVLVTVLAGTFALWLTVLWNRQRQITPAL